MLEFMLIFIVQAMLFLVLVYVFYISFVFFVPYIFFVLDFGSSFLSRASIQDADLGTALFSLMFGVLFMWVLIIVSAIYFFIQIRQRYLYGKKLGFAFYALFSIIILALISICAFKFFGIKTFGEITSTRIVALFISMSVTILMSKIGDKKIKLF